MCLLRSALVISFLLSDSVLDHGDVARKVYEYSHKRAEKERAEKQRKAMEKVQPKKDKK